MKNKGIKIGVVFILLFALLSVAGCQQADVVIVGAESGQPGPTSGQRRIGFTLLVSKGASTQPVSYTHLDVYKRQPHFRASASVKAQ